MDEDDEGRRWAKDSKKTSPVLRPILFLKLSDLPETLNLPFAHNMGPRQNASPKMKHQRMSFSDPLTNEVRPPFWPMAVPSTASENVNSIP